MRFTVVLLILLFGYATAKTSEKRAKSGYTQEEIENYKGYNELDKAAQLQVPVIGTNNYSRENSFRPISPGSTNQLIATNAYSIENGFRPISQGSTNQLIDTNAHSGESGVRPINQLSADQFIDTNGYSRGSGVRSIAQGSAHGASLVTKNQNAAAQQAAYLVQVALAKAAIQAAETASAALVGKEALIEHLEAEKMEAARRLESEIAQFEHSKKLVALARATASHTAGHVAKLTAALNSAKLFAEKAEAASQAAEADLASQTAMVGKVKGQVNSIASKLGAAQIDFQATKEAASKAMSYAKQARDNAEAAEENASVQLHEVAELMGDAFSFPHD